MTPQVEEPDDIRDLLAVVYAAVARGSLQEATNTVMASLDDWLRGGHYDRCDALLAAADVARLSPATTRAVLVMTKPAKAHLSSRPGFFVLAVEAATGARGAAIAQRLFSRLV